MTAIINIDGTRAGVEVTEITQTGGYIGDIIWCDDWEIDINLAVAFDDDDVEVWM